MSKFNAILAAAAGSLLIAVPALASDTPIADPSADDNAIICKKTLETGSLVRKTKQCFTRAQWAEIAESQRRGAERLVHDLTSKKGDNN